MNARGACNEWLRAVSNDSYKHLNLCTVGSSRVVSVCCENEAAVVSTDETDCAGTCSAGGRNKRPGQRWEIYQRTNSLVGNEGKANEAIIKCC